MKVLIFLGFALVIFCILFMAGLLPRFIYSAYLILRTKPFERTVQIPAGKVLVAGDSTGYGTGVSNPADSIAGRIGADFLSYSIKNISKNGITTHGLVPLLQNHTVEDAYDVVLLQIGGNDILTKRPLEDIERDIRAAIRQAQQLGTHVVVMTAGNVGSASAFVKDGVPDAAFEKHTRDVRVVFTRVAQDHDATYIDLFEEPQNDLFLQQPDVYLASDGLHPSGKGYALWYKKLHPSLVQLLQ